MNYRHPSEMTDLEEDLLNLIYEICELKEKADKNGSYITSDEFNALLNKRYLLMDKAFGYHWAQESANASSLGDSAA